MLATNNVEEMREFCTALHPASVADFLIGLTPSEIWSILRNIDPKIGADIFSYFEEDLQVQIIESAPRDEIAGFIEYLPSDDRVDILDEVEEDVVDELMPLLDPEDRQDIRQLSSYPEGTCGAEMSTDFLALRDDMTFSQALDAISKQSPVLETVYYLYVLNSVDRLVGLLSAKELLRHIGTPGALIRDYMKTDLITIDAGADREDAAKLVAKYDFIAVPVVDHDGRMLGIITHDDVLDTIIEEMAENAHLSAAVAPLADPYLATDLWTLARKRFTWLAILLFGAVTTALILNGFDSVSKKIVWLVAFLPMIVSTGGNTGGQSATLVITALATGEITLRDWWRIVHREVLMGVLLGVAMGACGLINALLIMGRSVPLTHLMVVPTAVFFVVFSSNLTGALLPLIFQRIGWDPALMSNPFVAGISDTLGTLIYMLLAVIFLL
ncbi:MAG: magnesium transporter [Thermoguttaceae bacterium]|nr:magnesium transporter [Thermoguttaceae bacterium]MBR3219541.1 magnesium transporter [Thermoguttaceae bacterium]